MLLLPRTADGEGKEREEEREREREGEKVSEIIENAIPVLCCV